MLVGMRKWTPTSESTLLARLQDFDIDFHLLIDSNINGRNGKVGATVIIITDVSFTISFCHLCPSATFCALYFPLHDLCAFVTSLII